MSRRDLSMDRSLYESMFKTRRRGRGRPEGGEIIFPKADKEADLAQLARQRAIAIVLEEGKERLHELFEREYQHLERNRREFVNGD